MNNASKSLVALVKHVAGSSRHHALHSASAAALSFYSAGMHLSVSPKILCFWRLGAFTTICVSIRLAFATLLITHRQDIWSQKQNISMG